MDKVAELSARERGEVFEAVAAEMGVAAAIVEKDFWVCYVLGALFERSRYREAMVFKGGTSLSKVHQLIERFSEDIDLILDWRLLGFEGHEPLEAKATKTQQDKFNKRVNELAGEFIAESIVPHLEELVRAADLRVHVAEKDAQVVEVRYPAAFSQVYIRPEVRLEIGPLAGWVPSARSVIRPYVAERLPAVFGGSDVTVIAIGAERTFWEKATILHAEAHRAGKTPIRHSRHYHDLYCLAGSWVRRKALGDWELLRKVVEFKQQFYPCGWANYETARSGTMRLLPREDGRLREMERDYADMRVMLFGEAPEWLEIVRVLRALEGEINAGDRR
jgi:hypothetical protein